MPPTISHYATAVLSVAVAVIAAELITRLLHAEAIASSMLCAVIFAAWIGGFGPGAVGDRPRPLCFPLLPGAADQFIYLEVQFIRRGCLGGAASDPVFRCITRCAFMVSAQRKTTESSPTSGDDLLAANADQKRTEAALRHSEMYLTEAQD